MDLLKMLEQMQKGEEGPFHPKPTQYKRPAMLEPTTIMDQFGNPVASDKEEDEKALLYQLLRKLRGQQPSHAQDIELPHPDLINGAPGMRLKIPL